MDPTIEESCEHTICFLLKGAPVNLEKIACGTAVDPTLQQVVTAIQENWPSSEPQAVTILFYESRAFSENLQPKAGVQPHYCHERETVLLFRKC